MSLIQDALKRKNEEPGLSPESSPSPVAPAPPPKTAGLKKKWMILAGAILLLTGGNTIFLVHHFALRNEEPVPVVQPKFQPEPKPEFEPDPVPESVPNSEPQKIVWPKLTCSGVATEIENPVVVINGKTLSVGDSVEGVKILKILKTMILLEFRGENRVLRIKLRPMRAEAGTQ